MMNMMNSFYGHYGWGQEMMGSWPWWFAGIGAIGVTFVIVFVVIALLLKGYALWHAAKRDEKSWFIILLIVNTFGILELIYLIFILKLWPKRDAKDMSDMHHHEHEGHSHHHHSHSNE